jgi:hypothetical protein
MSGKTPALPGGNSQGFINSTLLQNILRHVPTSFSRRVSKWHIYPISTLIFAFKNFGLVLLKDIFGRFVEPNLGLIVYVTLKCPHIDI